MRIIFMGTPDFAVPSLKALNEAFDVVDEWLQQPCVTMLHPTDRHASVVRGLLAPLGTVRRTALFCTLSVSDDGLALFEHFARRAILLRRFAAQGLLRFGLPGSEAEWQRLSAAIRAWSA